jgi:flagellar motility protein MotE (MotC chaperone)
MLILAALLIKLAISFGSFLLPKGESVSSLLTQEVMAEEHGKDAGKKDAAQKSGAAKDGSASKAGSASSASAPAASAAPQDSLSSAPNTLAYIAKKEAELKQREDAVQKKEASLAEMEKDVEKKMNNLIAAQQEVQAYRAEREEGQSAKVKSLVKIYESMKPKDAAKLMENLDDKLVVFIVSSMTSDGAASILTNMDPKKAAKISEALTNH